MKIKIPTWQTLKKMMTRSKEHQFDVPNSPQESLPKYWDKLNQPQKVNWVKEYMPEKESEEYLKNGMEGV